MYSFIYEYEQLKKFIFIWDGNGLFRLGPGPVVRPTEGRELTNHNDWLNLVNKSVFMTKFFYAFEFYICFKNIIKCIFLLSNMRDHNYIIFLTHDFFKFTQIFVQNQVYK